MTLLLKYSIYVFIVDFDTLCNVYLDLQKSVLVNQCQKQQNYKTWKVLRFEHFNLIGPMSDSIQG